MNVRPPYLAALVAALALGTACDGDKKSNTETPVAGSAMPKSKSRLAKAIEAAADTSASPSAERQGPPPTGVFTKAASDAEQPPGAPAKLVMVKKGDGATVRLAPTGLETGARFSMSVSASVFQGPLPAMVYTLEVGGADAKDKADKPKGDAPKGDASPPAAGPRALTLRVVEAKIDPSWRGKLQDGGDKILAKLKGSKITATLDARGGLSGAKVEVAKEVEGAAYIVEAMAQALGFAFVPVPEEPVGEDASWLVSDRTRIGGLELIRYRAVTLKKLAGDDVVLAVDVRHYGPSPDTVPEGLPPGVETMGVESFGQATVTRKAGDVAPQGAKLSYPVDVLVGKGGQPAGKFRAEVKAELGGLPSAAKK